MSVVQYYRRANSLFLPIIRISISGAKWKMAWSIITSYTYIDLVSCKVDTYYIFLAIAMHYLPWSRVKLLLYYALINVNVMRNMVHLILKPLQLIRKRSQRKQALIMNHAFRLKIDVGVMAAIRLLAEMWNWKVSSLQIHSDHAMFCTAIEFCVKTTTTTEIEAFEILHVFCVKKNSSLESKSNEQKVAKKDDFNWFTNTKSQNPRWWFTWNFHWKTKKMLHSPTKQVLWSRQLKKITLFASSAKENS